MKKKSFGIFILIIFIIPVSQVLFIDDVIGIMEDRYIVNKNRYVESHLIEVSILKPFETFVYFRDNQIFVLPSETIIFGNITVIASAISLMFVDKMEFYIDENLKYTVTEPDVSWQWVSWKWDETIFFKHNLKVIAYDKMNTSASDEIEVWIFNF